MTSGITRMNQRWAELADAYPLSDADASVILSALADVARGRSPDVVLQWHPLLSGSRLEPLFRELAAAYLRDN